MSRPAPAETPLSPLGSLWEIPAKTAAKVTRPDGVVHTVLSNGKTAGYVLDQAGDYLAVADGKTHTVKAG